MKKKLSLLLVLAMILTLVPMSAFAASSNGVVSVPKVADTTVFKLDASHGDAAIFGDDTADETDAPMLRIEEENVNEFADGKTFTLEVKNGDWEDTVSTTVYATDADGQDIGKVAWFTMVKRSDKEVEVTFNRFNKYKATKVAAKLPMVIDVDEEGPVEVEIDGENSGVSSNKHTVANSSDGNTITTINDTTDIIDEGATIETIKIEETNIGSMLDTDDQEIELRLPSDFKWVVDSATAELSAGFKGTLSVEIKKDTDGNNLTNYVVIKDKANKLNSTDARGKIYIKGLKVVPESDADYGEVKVKVSGDNVTTANIVIGEYQDYGLKITADEDDDMVELIAGRFVKVTEKVGDTTKLVTDRTTAASGEYDSDDHELVTLKLEENAEGAWLTQRKTRIEFPKWVKIIDVTVDKADGFVKDKDDLRTALLAAIDDDDFNFIEFSGGNAGADFELDGKAKLHLTFEVSIKADATGDIVAKVSGRGTPNEGEVVLGKALAPVTVKTEPVDVKLGYQDQKLGKIILTESRAEALKDGKTLSIELAEDFEWDDDPTVEVTKGDLEIDEDSVETDGRYLTFDIKGESSEASEITIAGGTVDLDRTLPEGDFKVDIQGDAVADNNSGDDDSAFGFDKNKCASDVFARVITPADDNTQAGQEVKFVIGNAEYQVGEEVKTADVAPYINSGRTMLSLRYVAEAMGVSSDNIMWDNETRTVTIFKGDRTAQVQIGSKDLMVNGVAVKMDAPAEIKDGRTCLPVSFVAKALGAEVAWDGATKTVTIK
jgi:copper amine oxidase-like protein